MAEETKKIEKAPDRLKVLERIDEYERKGWWSKDVEDDPETIPLKPEQVDYLNKKLINKILSKIVNKKAYDFIENLIKNGQLIIKDVHGIENFTKLANQGTLITCNHFNAFDNFAIHHIVLPYLHKEKRDLYKVIREGNYTNFPGLYGLFFRHCNTLPLSANFSTMKKFLGAVDILLKRGEKILSYAEQGMWWNYRKPRPLTNGAFNLAVKSDVPVLPMFITMTDSDKIGSDGFPIQEYTVHILEPIYPDPAKTKKENIEFMRDKNYEMWKKVYEDFYGIPLTYLTENDVSNN
ncbi:MAG: 1-acyl-sn-glycerol-3-phosphate acyltransferase [Treponema sp.]|nr:1-acyl-sn-glycerol-3-phosphate acyltransferase [Treponema sp.]